MPTWQIGESGTEVTLDGQGRGEVTFTVTNTSAAQDRSVLTITPLDGAAESWFAVEEPQRAIGPGASAAYLCKVEAPAGTAPGTYAMQAVAYSADRDPGETSTTSRRVTMTVKETKPVPRKTPWWIFLVAALVLLAVIGVILWLVFKDDGGLANEDPPVITGTPEVLQTLETSTGTWSEDDDLLSFAFQWQRCDAEGGDCEAIEGANFPAYQVGAADEGRALRVEVTANLRADAGSASTTTIPATGETVPLPEPAESATASSDPTGPVAEAPEPDPIPVPGVIDLTISQATAALSPNFQVVRLVAGPASGSCDPPVQSQDPSPNVLLAPGEQVTIVSQPVGGPFIRCAFPVLGGELAVIPGGEFVTEFQSREVEEFQEDLEGRQVTP